MQSNYADRGRCGPAASGRQLAEREGPGRTRGSESVHFFWPALCSPCSGRRRGWISPCAPRRSRILSSAFNRCKQRFLAYPRKFAAFICIRPSPPFARTAVTEEG